MDISYSNFGRNWGHVRSFSNIFAPAQNGVNGINWYANNLPYLIAHGKKVLSTLVLMTSPREALWYDRIGKTDDYSARFDQKSTIAHDTDAGAYILTDADGNRMLFFDFQTVNKGGMFKGLLNANGLLSLASYDQQNRIVALESASEEQNATLKYEYHDGAKPPGKLSSVTLEINEIPCRRASYEYYAAGEKGGLPWDLKKATVEEFNAARGRWTQLRFSYYRYHISNTEIGYPHGLLFSVGPEAYDRAINDGIFPETATDEQLAGYADYYFEYDWKRRVTLERANGGRDTFTFKYESNPNIQKGYNSWVNKTTETLPDLSQNIVYTNATTQVITKILQAGNLQWGKHYQYDKKGRKLLVATSSAIAGYDESTPMVAQLRREQGLIRTYEYYSDDDELGQPSGYLRYEQTRAGSDGVPTILKEYSYAEHSVGYDSIYPLAKSIVYQGGNENPRPSVTEYIYDEWYQEDGFETFQIKQKTTIAPFVPVDQNGSGESSSGTEIYDRYGRQTWFKNSRGFLTATVSDPLTGGLIRRIEDVNTKLTPAPNGWSTPEGGGLQLITDFTYDYLGRQVRSLGPQHRIDLDGIATEIRRAAWSIHIDERRQVLNGTGYAIQGVSGEEFVLVSPVTVTAYDQRNRTIETFAASRETQKGELSANDRFPQTSYSRWKKINYDVHNLLVSEVVYFSIPEIGGGTVNVNYYETTFGYDLNRRPIRMVDGAGTIRRLVVDPRGLATETWIGTDDRGASSGDPSGGTTKGNNMRIATKAELDNGSAAGNGNITKSISCVDDESTNNRIINYQYDYRDRRIASAQTGNANTWIRSTEYDNCDRAVRNITFLDKESEQNRIAEDRSFYDDAGRLYRHETDGIDPESGKLVNTLATEKWHDLEGNEIKVIRAGSTSFIKTEYDALNRPTVIYQACSGDSGDLSAENTSDVSSDIVLEQTEIGYDAGGNEIQRVTRERFHDARGTGALKNITVEPKARVTWKAIWPDGVGRDKIKANFGTNGGKDFNRPDIAPDRSEDVLVSTNLYGKAGESNGTIDPMGCQTRWQNDNMGRRISLIENFVEAHPEQARVSDYTWHPSNQLSGLKVSNNQTGDQITNWTYGVTLDDSQVADNNILRCKVYPERDTRLYFEVNRSAEVTRFTDADGTIHGYEYDKLGRLTSDTVEVAAEGIDCSVSRITREYDIAHRLSRITSYDAPKEGNVVNEVILSYDAFGSLAKDQQSHDGKADNKSPAVIYDYENGSGNTVRKRSVTYPSGKKVGIYYGESKSVDDHFNRITSVRTADESDSLAEYAYIGVARQIKIGYTAPEVELTYEGPIGDAGDKYSGYDRFGRTVDIRWQKSGENKDILEHLKYNYDRDSRPVLIARELNHAQDYRYTYDGLGQVISALQGNSASGDISPTHGEAWQLDPTGNWQSYTTTENGIVTMSQERVHDAGNRLTSILKDPYPVVIDQAGRTRQAPPDALASWSGSQTIKWDAWNRITQITDTNDGKVLGEYRYDGLSRRIKRLIEDGVWHCYYSNEWKPLEELDDKNGGTKFSYFWGARHRDDLIRRDKVKEDTSVSEERHYILMEYYSPVALTDAAGGVTERYNFTPFGIRQIFDPHWNIVPASEAEVRFSFQGHFVDPESGFFDYGYRYYSPSLGRWLSKDPLATMLSASFVADSDFHKMDFKPTVAELLPEGPNLYSYVGNSPTAGTDFLGLRGFYTGGWVCHTPNYGTGCTYICIVAGFAPGVTNLPSFTFGRIVAQNMMNTGCNTSNFSIFSTGCTNLDSAYALYW